MATVATRRTNGVIRFKKRHDLTVNRNAEPTPPDRKTMAKNLLAAAGQLTKNGFKPRSKEDQEKCLTICKGDQSKGILKCDHYIKTEDRCAKCGCYIKWKSMLRAWSCPVNKW